MINVEGEYDEIVDWLNRHPVAPVRHVMSRGAWEGISAADRLNVGLFSVVPCSGSYGAKGRWSRWASIKTIVVNNGVHIVLTEEEKATGHLYPPEGGVPVA